MLMRLWGFGSLGNAFLERALCAWEKVKVELQIFFWPADNLVRKWSAFLEWLLYWGIFGSISRSGMNFPTVDGAIRRRRRSVSSRTTTCSTWRAKSTEKSCWRCGDPSSTPCRTCLMSFTTTSGEKKTPEKDTTSGEKKTREREECTQYSMVNKKSTLPPPSGWIIFEKFFFLVWMIEFVLFSGTPNKAGHRVRSLPWSEGELAEETSVIIDPLANLNQSGVLTINSQPNVNQIPSTDKVHGWGDAGGYVYQKVSKDL